MKRFAFAATAIAITFFGCVAAAYAAPATTNTVANVRGGPGTNYSVVGSLPRGASIDAECYSHGWCMVAGTGMYSGLNGWMANSLVSFSGGYAPGPRPQPAPGNGGGFSFEFNFGNQPPVVQPYPPVTQPPRPPRPQPPVYEPAQACFYSDRNFRGSSFCLGQGEGYDRMPRGWDDTIRSVQVTGGARVDLCSERNQYGACATLRSSASRLPGNLDWNVSSVDVY